MQGKAVTTATAQPLLEIGNERLARQRLAGPPAESIEAVVRGLCAMQAQEYGPAKWSIAQRASGITNDDVDAALASGRIIRTHILRPTWHFVHASDIRWLMSVTAPRVQAFNAPYYRQTDLSPALLARTTRLLAKWLGGGAELTRADLALRLEKEGIRAAGLRLASIMMNAELEQVVCSGRRQGKQHAYALFDERVPTARPLPHDVALARLAHRYFSGHGPGTVKDFRWWSSLQAKEATLAIEAAGSALESIVVSGRMFWRARDVPKHTVPGSGAAHLIQAYDEYVVAFTESKDVFNVGGAAGRRASDGMQFLHAILLDTQVVGHWRVANPARAEVDSYVNRSLSRAESASVRDAIRRYRAFASPEK